MLAGCETISDAGDGAPWLVMVHGMSQDRRVFSAQVEAFRRRCRILLVDLPGHGLSADIPGPFGHAELAGHVAAALAAAGIDACHYWGTHTGTAIALLLALEAPARFRSLVLEGAVLPGQAMPSVDAALQQARTLARTAGVAEARWRWFDEADWFQVMREDPGPCRAAAHRAIVEDFSGAPWLYDGPAASVPSIEGRLAELDLPVLLYNGARDLPDFIATAGRLAARLPRARWVRIPDAGGFPAWERPDRVNREVAEFLAPLF